jgi:ureidoglycolate hydrolase
MMSQTLRVKPLSHEAFLAYGTFGRLTPPTVAPLAKGEASPLAKGATVGGVRRPKVP